MTVYIWGSSAILRLRRNPFGIRRENSRGAISEISRRDFVSRKMRLLAPGRGVVTLLFQDGFSRNGDFNLVTEHGSAFNHLVVFDPEILAVNFC